MEDFFRLIPNWVWWVIGIIVIVKLLSSILNAIKGELDHINQNLGVIANNQLDQLERLKELEKLDDVERHSRKLDLLDSVEKLDNLDELVWWEKDKSTFATQVIDLLEKISNK
jgi:hypothetical protein